MSAQKDTRLRVGLIGAGVFAGYHAGKIAAHERTAFCGVLDASRGRSAALAEVHGTQAIATLDTLFELADAVVIASPASTHADYAVAALRAGCHVLVEKPFATSRAGAEAILAARGNRVVQVGHQERVVLEAIGLLGLAQRPVQLDIIRHGARATRNLDTSVVMDLMIHDIDLLGALYGAPEWVSTELAQRRYSEHFDVARAELGYGDFTAYLSASRDGEPGRRWNLRYGAGTVEIDFANKTLRNGTPYELNEAFGDAALVKDSLAAAFDRFVSACLDGHRPLASAEDGRDAVRIASQIEGDI